MGRNPAQDAAREGRLSPQATGAGFAVAALAVDQASKWLVIHVVMVPPRTIEVAPFLNLVLGRNTGVVFGIFAGRGDLGRWLLVALALAIVAGLLIWLFRARDRATAAALGLVIGGALGNVVDRLRLGGVTDFIDLHAGGYHWPAFNLADAAIVASLVLLVIGERHATRRGPDDRLLHPPPRIAQCDAARALWVRRAAARGRATLQVERRSP